MDGRFQEAENKIKTIQTKTIDDVLYLNSLLTFAVFIGLSQASTQTRSLENRDECNAGPGVAKALILYEVLAFACFLSSSLSAKALKLLIRLDGVQFTVPGSSSTFDLKNQMFILTACSSISGIVLLVISVVELIQIQIGLFSCGSRESRLAIMGVCTIVSISLIMYVVTISLGIYAAIAMEYDAADTVPLQQISVRTDELV